MPLPIGSQEQLGAQSVYLDDKDKVLSFSADMDEHDIGHHLRVNEYGEKPVDSAAKYMWEASKRPQSVIGKLKNSIMTKIGLHPDKDAIGARAVIALNEIDRVRQSDFSDEEKSSEIISIYEDLDKYLAGKGVRTKQQQTVDDYQAMLTTGMALSGYAALEKFGAWALTKGLLKFTAVSESMKRAVYPAIKASYTPEGETYEYEPTTLADLMGVKSETPGLKTTVDVIDWGISGGIVMSPKILRQAKIDTVINEALPRLEALFIEKGVKIPEGGLTPEFVHVQARNSPALGEAIIQAADRLPFYKAFGNRGAVRLPSFKPGDEIKVGTEMAKVIKTEGENVVLEIAGAQVIKKISEIQQEPPIEKPKAEAKPVEETISDKIYRERGFVSSVQEELPEIKVAGQYIPRDTDNLAIKAKNLIKDDIVLAEKMAKEGADDNAVAVGAQLLKHYAREAKAQPEGVIKDAIYEKAAELGNSLAERLTELGRSVQAASILSRLTPEGQIRFAAKTIQKYNEEITKRGWGKKIPELTKDQAKEITERMKEISEMPEGENKAMAYRDLHNYISDMVPTPIYQKAVTLWKAGLLTGLKTSGVNILANASHAFGTEVIKDIPAVAVDSVAALFTKKRAVAFTTRGIKEGVASGIKNGWQFIKTGYDERRPLEKYDYKRVSFGTGKFAKGIQKYEETVFNILGAEDQPFYYGAKARSLHEQAKVQAINKGLKGKEAENFIDEIMKNPTDEMLIFAAADAETAVFQNRTILSDAANKIKQIPGMEFILPFSKTPSAVAMQIVNYSPALLVKATRLLLDGLKSGNFNQKDFSKILGRVLTGTGILALGAYLFRQGLVVLDKPRSESERKLWELEGRKPNSIKVGDKYRSIQVLGPAGNVLLMGAQFQNALTSTGSISESLKKGFWGSLKSFTEQTYLTGVSQSLEAISEPEKKGERFFSGLISSVVPTIVADVARGTDPKMRRAEGINKLIERVPILRQSLEPQIDVLGGERYRKENFLETIADPTRPYTAIREPVAQEIRRLVDAGQKIQLTQLGDKEGYKILTPQQNTEIWQRAGSIAYEKLYSLMQIPAYGTVADDIKTKKINEILDKAKLVARTEKVIEITVGLQDEELKSKLSEAKKSGLMNREVFNLYQRLR